jgi:signal peptidase I
MSTGPQVRSAGERFLRPLIVLACVAGAAVILLRVVVLSRYKVPAGSMLPTIEPGQTLVVNKLVKTPKRGHVIVFGYPEHPDQDFVKRVVALEGDRLEIKNGRPFLNGWAIPSCKLGAFTYTDAYDGGSHAGDVWVEFLGDASYLTFYEARTTEITAAGPWTAKSGEAWVLGDNRNNSHDSRMWFGGRGGGVPHELVRGTPIGLDGPVLPKSAAGLQPALDACMKSRPAADPPPR